MLRKPMRLLRIAACVIATAAQAHEVNVPFADWFNSLKQPDSPTVSCCGVADQFYVDEYEVNPDEPAGFIAIVNGSRIEVPARKVDWTDVNPTGRGVIFLLGTEQGMGPTVLCFVPGFGT
jgi:hypothetical protein